MNTFRTLFPIIVNQVHDQFVKRINEALIELDVDARISTLEELYDNETSNEEETCMIPYAFEA